jgi:hypothetical protein
MSKATLAPTVWSVRINTPSGEGIIDVPTYLGIDTAARRGIQAAAQMRWGDLDEIYVVEVTEAT